MSVREIMAARLRDARHRAGLSGKQVGEAMGKSPSTVYSWESGQGQPDADALLRLCDIYGVDINEFYDVQNTSGRDGTYVDVPHYGRIAAGGPEESRKLEGFVEIPATMHDRYPDAFLLTVRGEGMDRRMPNGSLALVNPTDKVESGRVYALCVGDAAATFWRVRLLENGYELEPDTTDPTIKPTVFDYGAEGTEAITVVGEVVWCVYPYDFEF